MDELLTTKQVSEQLKIPASTIRSWLTRYPDLFHLEIHLVKDENGRNLWTKSGVDLLRSRKNADENAAPVAADEAAEDLLEAVLDRDSDILATRYYERLPLVTLQKIKNWRLNPTPEQRQIVTRSVQNALTVGTQHLLLPDYEPRLLIGGEDATPEE